MAFYDDVMGAEFLIFENFEQAEFIFHPQNIPFHFERLNRFKVEKQHYLSIFRMGKVVKRQLPRPYSTDCVDYESNKIGFKSQTYCKLDYMRRKDLEICGQNYYWSQRLFVDTKQREIQTFDLNTTFSNCTIKLDNNELDKYCKPDCENVQFSVNAVKVKQGYRNSNKIYSMILLAKSNYSTITYLPKMDVITGL